MHTFCESDAWLLYCFYASQDLSWFIFHQIFIVLYSQFVSQMSFVYLLTNIVHNGIIKVMFFTDDQNFYCILKR